VKPVYRHPSVVAEHRTEIMQLIRRGWTQTEIATKFGIAQETVSKDYRMILKEWREQRVELAADEIETKLAEYREIRSEAWAAWERSKLDAEKETHVTGDSFSTTTRTKEGRTPANEYLRTVLNCLQAERELLGLDVVKEVHVKGQYLTAQVNWSDLAQHVPDHGPVPDLIEQSVRAALTPVGEVTMMNHTGHENSQALPTDAPPAGVFLPQEGGGRSE
jgi:hypothetical protein